MTSNTILTSNTRYNNGKIYKIINNFNDMVYIGSTCLPLRKRIFNHKKEQQAGRSPNRHLFQLVSEAPTWWHNASYRGVFHLHPGFGASGLRGQFRRPIRLAQRCILVPSYCT